MDVQIDFHLPLSRSPAALFSPLLATVRFTIAGGECLSLATPAAKV